MTKAQDNDLTLKLRLSRILFGLGYWCPLEVELSHYEAVQQEIKRKSLTDLDVLGIKFDQLFSKRTIVGDCKTGKNVSDANRLFWLLGVKEYFGADEAYFLRPRIDSHAKAIAPKMGLRVLADPDITTIEKTLNVDTVSIPLTDLGIRGKVTDLWGIALKKGQTPTPEERLLKNVYSYLTYSFWYIERYRNLLTLIGHFESIAHLLDPLNPRHVLLAHVGAERFGYSLLEVASHVQAQGGNDIARQARTYLYGGTLALKDKEQFFELLRKVTGQNESLDPPALGDVLELLARLMRNPEGAADVLRHLWVIYFWCTFLGNSNVPSFPSFPANTAALVLAKDVASTFAKATGVNRALFKSMEGL